MNKAAILHLFFFFLLNLGAIYVPPVFSQPSRSVLTPATRPHDLASPFTQTTEKVNRLNSNPLIQLVNHAPLSSLINADYLHEISEKLLTLLKNIHDRPVLILGHDCPDGVSAVKTMRYLITQLYPEKAEALRVHYVKHSSETDKVTSVAELLSVTNASDKILITARENPFVMALDFNLFAKIPGISVGLDHHPVHANTPRLNSSTVPIGEEALSINTTELPDLFVDQRSRASGDMPASVLTALIVDYALALNNSGAQRPLTYERELRMLIEAGIDGDRGGHLFVMTNQELAHAIGTIAVAGDPVCLHWLEELPYDKASEANIMSLYKQIIKEGTQVFHAEHNIVFHSDIYFSTLPFILISPSRALKLPRALKFISRPIITRLAEQEEHGQRPIIVATEDEDYFPENLKTPLNKIKASVRPKHGEGDVNKLIQALKWEAPVFGPAKPLPADFEEFMKAWRDKIDLKLVGGGGHFDAAVLLLHYELKSGINPDQNEAFLKAFFEFFIHQQHKPEFAVDHRPAVASYQALTAA